MLIIIHTKQKKKKERKIYQQKSQKDYIMIILNIMKGKKNYKNLLIMKEE